MLLLNKKIIKHVLNIKKAMFFILLKYCVNFGALIIKIVKETWVIKETDFNYFKYCEKLKKNGKIESIFW